MSIIENILKTFASPKKGLPAYEKISFSQTGEDIIMDFILQQIKITKPSYLDVGAHHPQYLSNTYLFYKKGFRGVNIEPDPSLMNEFLIQRKEDKNLNIGVGFKEEMEIADFFIMSARALNTFSKEDAEKYQGYGTYKIDNVIQVPLVSINKIIEEYFPLACPNIVSIDVEGLDFQIVKSFDFSKYRPEIFCIETLTYTEDNTERKLDDIIDYICAKDYLVFADTYINTILVDKQIWQHR